MYNNDLPTRAELPSSQQLLRSTVIALLIAIVLLITVVLPAEYGIDLTGIGRPLGLTQMGEIKMALAVQANAATAAEANAATAVAAAPPQAANTSPLPTVAPVAAVATTNPNLKTDELTVALRPGEAIEVKLVMQSGAKVNYEWHTDGEVVTHDTHGEGANGTFQSFSQGNVAADAGELIAPFAGNHGWYWYNPTNSNVNILLKTTGEYLSIR
jgi:hypothetical protein